MSFPWRHRKISCFIRILSHFTFKTRIRKDQRELIQLHKLTWLFSVLLLSEKHYVSPLPEWQITRTFAPPFECNISSIWIACSRQNNRGFRNPLVALHPFSNLASDETGRSLGGGEGSWEVDRSTEERTIELVDSVLEDASFGWWSELLSFRSILSFNPSAKIKKQQRDAFHVWKWQ